MGLFALIAGFFTVVSAVKYHSFGFDGSLTFFDEFLTEVIKTYTGTENIDLSKCMNPEFLKKFEDNLISIDQKIKDLNFFDAGLAFYVMVDDIVRFSNACDAGFTIPKHIIADNAIQIGFYINIAAKSQEIQVIVKDCYANLMMGFFKAAGKNVGTLMKIVFPLESQSYISNENYLIVMNWIFNEIADQSSISKCSEKIATIINSSNNLYSKIPKLVAGDFMAISSIIFEIKPLIANIMSLGEDCPLSSGLDKISNVFTIDGIKYSAFRYYLNKEKIIEIADEFLNGKKNPEETGKLLGKLINKIFAWDDKNSEKVDEDVYNQVMQNALKLEGEKCPEILNKSQEKFKELAGKWIEKSLLIQKTYNKHKSRVIRFLKSCGLRPFITALPLSVKEIEDLLKGFHKTSKYVKEDL